MKSFVVRQRGIAVITVLLALAIAVVISSEVIMRVYSGVKRAQNRLDSQQAWQYALGGEAWARQVLAADKEHDKQKKVDHFNEEWAQPRQKMQVDNGTVEIVIYDMQSRFNLNNLVNEDGVIQSAQLKIFNRLLGFVGVRPKYADLAAQWASYADDADNLYQNEKIPYRPADTQFASISELRLLRDIEMKEYRRLQPFVAALPEPVKVNINTASEPVLAALSNTGNKSVEKLRSFLQRREQQTEGFPSPDAFINMMGIQNDDLREQLSVNSQYFEVRVIADYAGRKVWLSSVLYRDEQTDEISLISRDTSLRFSLDDSVQDREKDSDKDKDKSRDEEGGADDRSRSGIGRQGGRPLRDDNPGDSVD